VGWSTATAAPRNGLTHGVRISSATSGSCHGTVHGRRIPPDRIGFNLVSTWREIFGGFPDPNPPLPREQKIANFWHVMAAMRAIGFRGIEDIWHILGSPSPWGPDAASQRARLAALGMRTFSYWSVIDPATYPREAELAEQLGADYAGGEPAGYETLEGALAEAAQLNQLGKLAAAHGLKLQVHNHAPQFQIKFMYDTNGDGVQELTSAEEVMMLNTDPRYVTWEVDIHWALVGLNLDNDALVAFLKKYADRIEVIHIKGTTAVATWPPPPTYYETDFAPVGSPQDITDWPRVFAALPNVRDYLYEWDFPIDGIEKARQSYAYLACVRF
jgi:sugar phosphate isomerase/epimerase